LVGGAESGGNEDWCDGGAVVGGCGAAVGGCGAGGGGGGGLWLGGWGGVGCSCGGAVGGGGEIRAGALVDFVQDWGCKWVGGCSCGCALVVVTHVSRSLASCLCK
jgi:hypothetical protein